MKSVRDKIRHLRVEQEALWDEPYIWVVSNLFSIERELNRHIYGELFVPVARQLRLGTEKLNEVD